MVEGLARLLNIGNSEEHPNISRRHSGLAAVNQTVTEYGNLLENVSADRAELLLSISKLQLQNAELSVGKALYAELEAELADFREIADKAREIAADRNVLSRQLTVAQDTIAELRREVTSLKGQVTRLKNKEGVKDAN